MKKITIFLFGIFCFIQPALASDNPAFQGKANQIMLHGGLSTRSEGFEGYRKTNADGSRGNFLPNLGLAMISYSQPTTFFKINARRNLEAGAMLGRKSGKVEDNHTLTPKDYSQYTQAIGGVSEDIVLGVKYLYVTVGLGAYIKSKSTNRINSAFTFGERIGIGTNAGPMNIELFLRHFSNGSLTDSNSGQNFAGLSLGVKF